MGSNDISKCSKSTMKSRLDHCGHWEPFTTEKVLNIVNLYFRHRWTAMVDQGSFWQVFFNKMVKYQFQAT